MGFGSFISNAFSSATKSISNVAKSFTNPKKLLSSISNPLTLGSLAAGYGIPMFNGWTSNIGFLRGGAQFGNVFDIAGGLANKGTFLSKLSKGMKFASGAKSFMDLGKQEQPWGPAGTVLGPQRPDYGIINKGRGFMDYVKWETKKPGEDRRDTQEDEGVLVRILKEAAPVGFREVLKSIMAARQQKRLAGGTDLERPEKKYVPADPFPPGTKFYSFPNPQARYSALMTEKGYPTYIPSLVTFAKRAGIPNAMDWNRQLMRDEQSYNYSVWKDV